MDSAEVGVFGESNKVGLGGFLYSQNSRGLKTEKLPEVLGNLTHKTLERCLAEEEIGGLLVPTDLTEGDGSRAVAVGLLDTSSGRGGLASGLGGELLARSLSSGAPPGGLLGTSHV